ncbi:MAG: outer membrane lipoprotein-sorting protein [Deltaproteobacteria bacterium]|nr:outer membrane lipoprotein-sorting protein [Deltaproteobacteria bacterium]
MKWCIIFLILFNCNFLYGAETTTKIVETTTTAAEPITKVVESTTRGTEPNTGLDILKKVDENYAAENRKSLSTMIIKGRRGTRTLQSQSWIQGVEKSFTEYLSPARDRGTKMLKLEEELWIYSPSTDRIIKIAGHMLRRSVMGSDLSYEDYMEDPKLSNMYLATIIGEEIITERLCYVLELTAKKEDIAYYSRKIWVDKERFLPLKEERYAKSGKLLKTFVINEVFQLENRWYRKKMIFKDVLKKGEGTEFIIDSIEFNVEIPDYIFSKSSLRK